MSVIFTDMMHADPEMHIFQFPSANQYEDSKRRLTLNLILCVMFTVLVITSLLF